MAEIDDAITAALSSSSPAPSRKPVARGFPLQPQSSECDSSIPFLGLGQPHHDHEIVSLRGSHEISSSDAIHQADVVEVGRLLSESHDISDRGKDKQNKLVTTKPSNPRRKAKKSNRYWRDYMRKFWLWEIIACIFSYVCFGSIVVVLFYERDKPLDDWGLRIPPPATISFLGTLAKASLVLVLSQILSQMKWLHFQDIQPLRQLKALDGASRGPLGSITVLLNSGKVLTSLAACLMILTILLDPFVQLVFAFPTKLVVDPEQPATFMRAEQMSGLDETDFIGLPLKLWSALTQGFSNTNFTKEVNCPTGNCTWLEPIKTLGVCGSCSPANVTKTCSPMVFFPPGNDSHLNSTNCGINLIDCGTNLTTCFYTFDDIMLGANVNDSKPLTIAMHSFKDSFSNNSVDGRWGTVWNATSFASTARIDKNPPMPRNDFFNATVVETFQNIYFPDTYSNYSANLYYNSSGGILEFATVKIPRTDLRHNNSNTDPPATCWTCKLNWCEKTFENLRVINNQLFSTVSEKSLWDFLPSQDSRIYGIPPEDIDFQTGTISSPVRYQYDDYEFLKLLDVFTSYYVAGDGISLSNLEGTNIVDNAGMRAALVDADDLNVTINWIAASLSEMVRTNDEIALLEARGDGQVSKSFIEVRWEWLILPIAILVMTTILLMIVARESYIRGVSTWKDDPTALLFHRVAGVEVDSGENKVIEPGNLAKSTSGVYIKLSSEEALTFVKCARKVKQG